MSFTRRKQAFTLIELLVSVSIMLILFSGALAAYTRYSEKQRSVAAAETIESAIKEVQNRSKIGYIAACDELVSNDIQVWTDEGNDLYYQIGITCLDPDLSDVEAEVLVDTSMGLGTELDISFVPYGGISLRELGDSTDLEELTSTLYSTRRTDHVVTFTLDRGGGIEVDY